MNVTLENIKARCTEVGDCWEWNLQMAQKGRIPMWTIGAVQKVYPKREAWKLSRAREVQKGFVIVNSVACGNFKCCNPEHLVCVTLAQALGRTIKTGRMHTQAMRAKIAETKRSKSKLSQEAVAEFRCGDEPVPALAAKHGISEAYGYMLRRGLHRKDYSSPFAGLGARP